jgi:hypothetical protein
VYIRSKADDADYEFMNAYAKADVAGDQVGEGNAVTAAFQAGCVTE